jgi:hypothetical protein
MHDSFFFVFFPLLHFFFFFFPSKRKMGDLVQFEQWKKANNPRFLFRHLLEISAEGNVSTPILDRLHCWEFCPEDGSLLLVYDDLSNASQLRFHQIKLVFNSPGEGTSFPFPRFEKHEVCVAVDARTFGQNIVWSTHMVLKNYFCFIVMEKPSLAMFLRPQLYVYDLKKRSLSCHATNMDCYLPSAPLCLVSVDDNRLNLIHSKGIITICLENGAPVTWTFGPMQQSIASVSLDTLMLPGMHVTKGRECVFVLDTTRQHLFTIQLSNASVRMVPLRFEGYAGSLHDITMTLISLSDAHSYLYFNLHNKSWTLHQPPNLEGCHVLGPLPTVGFISGGTYWRDRGLLLQIGISGIQQKSVLTLVMTAMGTAGFILSLPGFRDCSGISSTTDQPLPSHPVKSIEPSPPSLKGFQSVFNIKKHTDEQHTKKLKTGAVPAIAPREPIAALASIKPVAMAPRPPSPVKSANILSYSLSQTARAPICVRVLRPVGEDYDQLESFLRDNAGWYALLQLFTRFVPSGGDTSYVYLGISHLLLKNTDCMEIFTGSGLVDMDEWRKLEQDMDAPLADKPLPDGKDPLVPASYEKAITIRGLSVLELVTLLILFHSIPPRKQHTMTFMLSAIMRLDSKRLAAYAIKYCNVHEDWCREIEFSELLHCIYHPRASVLGLDALKPLVGLVYRDLLAGSQSDGVSKNTLERTIKNSSDLFLRFLRDAHVNKAPASRDSLESTLALKRPADQLY